MIAEGSGPAQSCESAQRVRKTRDLVEPTTITLDDAQAAALDAIVTRRLAYMGGTAEEVRAYTARECVVAGLMAVALAEQVAL